jgi:hypothetical protein
MFYKGGFMNTPDKVFFGRLVKELKQIAVGLIEGGKELRRSVGR